MDQKVYTAPSENKKTWSSPSLKTINLNAAQHGTTNGNDGGGFRTKS